MEKYLKNPPKKIKFIVSLISAIVFQIGFSTLLSMGELSLYFLSYFHNENSSLNQDYDFLMYPLIIFFLNAFSPLSGFIIKKFGPRKSILISSAIVEIILICFCLQENIIVFYLLLFLLGIGTGLSSGICLKNVCSYYPKNKGFIGSIIICTEWLEIFFMLIIGENIINPNLIYTPDPYYPIIITERIKYFFIFEIFIIFITTLICILLFYPYNQNCEILNSENNSLSNVENDNNDVVENRNLENNYNEENTNTKEIIFNFRFWINMIIICVMPFWIIFLSCNYKIYNDFFNVYSIIGKNISIFVIFSPIFFGPIFAFCVDKFGYKIIIKIIGIICILCVVVFLIFFCIKNKIIYSVGVLISFCGSKTVIISLINQHIMKIYEMKNFLIVGGFSKLFVELFYFILKIISIFIFKDLEGENINDLTMKCVIITVIGIILSGGGFMLTFLETDENFCNKDENKNASASYMISKESKNRDEKELLTLNNTEINNDLN